MPTTDQYVQWLDANQHLKGTPRYNGVLQEYRNQFAVEKQQYEAYQAQQAQLAQQAQQAKVQQEQALTGTLDLLQSGGIRALAASRISGDVLFNGEQEQENAAIIAEALREGQKAVPEQLTEARQAFSDEAEMFERGEYVKGTLNTALEFGKQIFTNPRGLWYSTAEQAANMAPGIVGAYLGGKSAALAAGATSAATGVGAAAAPFIAGTAAIAGGIAGGFAGQAPVEAGSEFIGKVGQELESRGLEVNEANVAALLRDRKWVTQAASDARVKGITTAAVDAAFTVGAGKLARGPMEKAIKQASRELGDTAEVSRVLGRAEQIVEGRGKGKKIGSAAAATALDVVGGGASEAAGQLAAYGDVNAEDVLQEMFGELGGAAFEIPTVAAGLARKRPAGELPDDTLGADTTTTPPPPPPPAGGTAAAAGQTEQETPAQKNARERKERIDQAMGVISQHIESTGNRTETQENEWSVVLQQQMGLSAKEASKLLNDMSAKDNKLITPKKGDSNTRSVVDEAEERRIAEERKQRQREKAGAIFAQATGEVPAPPAPAAETAATETAATETAAAAPVAPEDDTYNKAVSYIDTLRADTDTALEARITRDLLAEKLGIDKEAASKVRKLLYDNGQIDFAGKLKSRPKPAAPAPAAPARTPEQQQKRDALIGVLVASKEFTEESANALLDSIENDTLPDDIREKLGLPPKKDEDQAETKLLFSKNSENLEPGSTVFAQIVPTKKTDEVDDRPLADATLQVITEDDDISLDNPELIGSVMLKSIVAKDRGKGVGSQLLTAITDYADRMQVPLITIPARPQLKDWYSRNGFEDRGDFMLREPKRAGKEPVTDFVDKGENIRFEEKPAAVATTPAAENIPEGYNPETGLVESRLEQKPKKAATEVEGTEGGTGGAESVAGGTGAGVSVPVSRKRTRGKGAEKAKPAAMGTAESGAARLDEREDEDESPVERAERRAKQAVKKETPAIGAVTQRATTAAAPAPAAAPAAAKPEKEKKGKKEPSVKQNTVEQRHADLVTARNEGRLPGAEQKEKLEEIKADIAKLPASDSPERKTAVSSVRKKLSVLESKIIEPAASAGRTAYMDARRLVTRLRDRLLDRTVSSAKKEKKEVEEYNKKVDAVYNHIKKNGAYDAEAIRREHGIDVVDSNEILRQLREERLVNFNMKDARLLGEGRVEFIGSASLVVNEDSQSKIDKVRNSLPANMRQVMLDVIESISENGEFDVNKISEDYGVNPDDSNYVLNELNKEGLLNIDENTIVEKKSKVTKKERFISTVRNVKVIGGETPNTIYATTLEQRLDELESKLDNLDPNEIDDIFGAPIENKGAKRNKQIELMSRLDTIEGMVEGSVVAKGEASTVGESVSRALDRDTSKDAYYAELQQAYDERNRGTKLAAAASASETTKPFRETLKELAIAGNLSGLLAYISRNPRNIGSDADELARWNWRTGFDPVNIKEAKIEQLKSDVANDALSKGKRAAAQRELDRLLAGKSHSEVKIERQIAAIDKFVDSIENDENRDSELRQALDKLEKLKQELDRVKKAREERDSIEAEQINPLNIGRIESGLSLGRDNILASIASRLAGATDLSSVTVVVEGTNKAAADFFTNMRKAGKVAAYDPSTNTMYLTEDAFSAPVYVMHEVAHAVTAVSVSEYGTLMAAGNGKTPVEQASERLDKAKAALDKAIKETGYDSSVEENEDNYVALEDQHGLPQSASLLPGIPPQVVAARQELDAAQNLMTRMAAVARIEEIYKEAKKQLGTIQYGDIYFQDILEFIAYAFTDIRLQMALSRVRMPKSMSKLSQIANKTFDMLSELSQTVLELIGLKPKSSLVDKAWADVRSLQKQATAAKIDVLRNENNLKLLSNEARAAARYEVKSMQDAIDSLNKQIEDLENQISQYSGASPFKQGLQNSLIDAERALVHYQNKLKNFKPEDFLRTYKLDKEAEYTNNIAKAKARIEEINAAYPKVQRNYKFVSEANEQANKRGVRNIDVDLEEGGALLDFLEAFENIMTAPGATTNLPIMYATKGKGKGAQQTKKPGYKEATTVPELDNVARESLQRKLKRETSKFLPLGKYYFGSLSGYRNLVRDYQNGKRWWLDFQNDLDISGKLELFGQKFNNIYDKITTSAAKAKNAYTSMFAGNNDNVDRGIVKLNNFLKKKMKTVKDPETGLNREWQLSDTTAWLDLRLKAMHIDERKAIKYLLNVPMSDVKNIPITMPDGSVVNMSAAGYRDTLYRELMKDEDMTVESGNGQAKLIRQLMENLVEGGGKFGIPYVGINPKTGFSAYLDPEGRATNDRDYPDGKVPKARPLDKNDERYNVYAGLDSQKAALLIADYNSIAADPEVGKTLTDLVANLREMQEKTKTLNKESRYQSIPVSNLIDFYGWDFYVPMKGVDGKTTEISPGDARWDIHGTRVASDVTDNPQAAAMGRMSDSDNVISRIKDDAFKSASRVGRDGVTTALGNIVEMLGKDFGEIALKVDFAERHTGAATKALNELRGRDNVFFDYKTDGTVIAYKINNKEAAFALRRTYEPITSFDTFLAKWTSRVSQLHTRFKLSFAPYDFVRNATFNSTVFAARYGVKKGAQMGMTVATRLGRNSWAKAGKVLLAHKKGDMATINKLAKKNPIYRDMYEFLEKGGESAYIQVFAQSGKLGTMLEDLDKGNFRMNAEKTGEFVTGAFDLYNNMFELANRSASYGVVRDEMIEKLTKDFKKKNSRDPNQAEKKEIYDAAMERAASYTKNLTNFELTGARANSLIARYAFFRPAATGAVTAADAIMPIWVDAKTMYENMSPELKAVLDKDPEARKNYAKNYREIQKNARTTAVISFLAGMAVYLMAFGMGDEDDEGRNKVAVDDKAQWTRNARIPLNWILDTLPEDSLVKQRFKDKVFNIPFGFGFGALASSGAQFAMLANGHVGFKDFLFNNTIIAADSFMPLPISRINPWEHENGPLIGGIMWAADSVVPSLYRPALELAFNMNGLGRSIFNENVNKYGPAYQSTDKVAELYSNFAQSVQDATGINIQPTEAAFIAGSYFDGIAEVASWANSMGDLYYTDRPFDPKTDTLVLNRFVGAPSRIDPKNFFKVQKQAQMYSERLKMYENTDPVKYREYVTKNPEAYWMSNIHNNVINGELKDIREEINTVRASKTYTPLMKQIALKKLYDRRDHIMYLTVDYYDRALGIEP